MLFGAGQVDLQHPRARVTAAQGFGVNHPRQNDVVGKHPGAQHLFFRVHAVQVGPQQAVVRFRGNRPVFTEIVRGHQNGVFDFRVARAAADIASNRFFHVRAGRGQVQVQQGFGGNHHAGDAKTALHRARLCETVGVYVLLP